MFRIASVLISKPGKNLIIPQKERTPQIVI
jgi:hypothetical protein